MTPVSIQQIFVSINKLEYLITEVSKPEYNQVLISYIDNVQIPAYLEDIVTTCNSVRLQMSERMARQIAVSLSESPYSYNNLRDGLMALLTAIHNELSDSFFVLVDYPALFADDHPFGPSVPLKFPDTALDISDAADCLCLGRYTASVFHLMRIMELSVRFLGTKLGVILADEKNWQNILDETNKAIKSLPAKTPAEKAEQSLYGQVAAHLFNVKIAWRNPTMHPKASYNQLEAEDIFNHVNVFIRYLADNI